MWRYMKKHFVLAALAAAALLAGCGASDSGAGADGHTPRLLAGKLRPDEVAADTRR